MSEPTKTACPICGNLYEDVYAHGAERRMKGGHALGPIELERQGFKKPEPVSSIDPDWLGSPWIYI